jgi:hypothetical protein
MGESDVMLANRQVAGKPCIACGGEVTLGAEVVRCSRCGGLHHKECWDRHGGCAAPGCAPAVAAAPSAPAAPAAGAPPQAEQTKPCPFCAEAIPPDADVCPYCGENLTGPAEEGVPKRFTAKCRGGVWNFTYTKAELIVQHPSGTEEVRVTRPQAADRVKLKNKKLIIQAGAKKYKFQIDDPAYVIVDYWLNQRLAKRTSAIAKDALTTAIVGVFICTPILAPYALYRASQAKKEIRAYPRRLKGEGLAVAAQVVATVVLVLLLLGIVIGVAQG